MNYFLINFKIKIDYVLVVLEQKLFRIWNPLVEYCQNLHKKFFGQIFKILKAIALQVWPIWPKI